MNEWFTDPKSIALMSAAAIQLVISVWRGEQNAAILAELVRWRSFVDQLQTKHSTDIAHNRRDIERLRNQRED